MAKKIKIEIEIDDPFEWWQTELQRTDLMSEMETLLKENVCESTLMEYSITCKLID